MNDTHVTTPEHRTAGGDALHDPRNNALPAVEGLDTTVVMKHPAPPDAVKQRFDELKINFLARYAKADVKSVLFVGTARGDGASTAAFNFATSLAKDNELRVLFINADLRGPPPAFKPLSAGEDESSGSEVLSITHWEPPNPLHEHGDNLQILPGGRGLVDPAVLFQSKRFDQFMLQMSERFDYIVIDGPPLSDAPESIALSTKVDGIILVMDAQRTRRKIALRAKRRIEEVGGKVLGIVLNRRTYYVPGWLYRHI